MSIQPLKVLGIDPGSRVCGYAFITSHDRSVINSRNIVLDDVGVIKADLNLSFMERISAIHETMFELVELHNPDICVIEDAFFGLNARSALKLGQARGALVAAVSRSSVDVKEVTPTQVKKMITGSGSADKEMISQSLKALIGFERGKLPYDASDALAIALCNIMLPVSADASKVSSSAAPSNFSQLN